MNTGDITLGVNSAVDEASTSTTNAIPAAMTQICGSADTGALVLNVVSNASAVNGSIQNTMIAVNGSVGSTSTTALGAVNMGSIESGVDAAVQGIVGMKCGDQIRSIVTQTRSVTPTAPSPQDFSWDVRLTFGRGT